MSSSVTCYAHHLSYSFKAVVDEQSPIIRGLFTLTNTVSRSVKGFFAHARSGDVIGERCVAITELRRY